MLPAVFLTLRKRPQFYLIRMATAVSTLRHESSHAAPHEADPAHEVFDLVDDTGAVIGQEARAVVHKLGLLHRAGAVLLLLQLLLLPACCCLAFWTAGAGAYCAMQFMCLFLIRKVAC